MWYREAKQNPHIPCDEIAEFVAAEALDFWSQQDKITATPNLSTVFAKQMTESFIEELGKYLKLSAKDPSDIYASIKNKAESYASLLYRELGMRYYLLLIDKRIREDLDQDEFKEILHKEIIEATRDLIDQTIETKSEGQHNMEQDESDSSPEALPCAETNYDFPFAEDIDLSETPHIPNAIIKK